ncbi:polymer-forming cytoskeletal protein [Janthinobacterium fluminis]|uniref:Polymer-forming cytoskeletal protein n=1 Tax=Janthinobacterium fluminis TaxID=2987524 RepID=A0ABT5K8F7_9BURK|nr:polymer-forming cytoskeletal protein [Janthinobacterium fluminis]MDC8760750.1 polymer-forming cytoskeletal protein [Janthinobacterium fluminis]
MAGIAQGGNLNFNGGAVAACTLSGSNYSCSTLAMSGSTDSMSIASGYAVTVAAGSFTFDYQQSLAMSGSAALTVNGSLDIGDIKPGNLSISGGTLTAKGGTFSMGKQMQAIVANVNAAAIRIDSGQGNKVTGNLNASGNIDIASHVTVIGSISGANIATSAHVTLSGDIFASGSFALASGSTLQGSVMAATIEIQPAQSTVDGNLTATTSLSLGSHSTVNGNLTAPVVDLAPAQTEVNGNVTASRTLTMGSGDAISGDVVAGTVTLDPANAYIGGNARVDWITLGHHGRVEKYITCNVYTPGNPCSCVTNNSGYDATTTPRGPACVAPPVAGPHHIRITHPGSALTCQPQTVTLTACANAACTAPHYGGGASVTLTPGGQAFAIGASGSNSGATVRQLTKGPANLAALANPAALNGVECVNTAAPGSAKPCEMAFEDSGLVLSLPNHVADAAANFSVRALQAAGDKQSCVPLFAGTSKLIDFGCAYSNPSSGSAHARFANSAAGVPADTPGACGASAGSAMLSFDADGVATGAWMKYADVGLISVSARYAPSSGSDAGLVVSGAGALIVAPASFSFERIWDGATPGLNNPGAAGPSDPVFMRAGRAFSATLSARNLSNNKTANFGAESPRQTATLAPLLVLPAGGSAGALTGSLTFAAGVASGNDLSWSEVGILQIQATLANPDGYLGSPGAPTRQGGAALIAKGKSGNVGRFIPDHFNTTVLDAGALTPGVPMVCIAGQMGCAGTKGFAYANQPFGVRVTALNAAEAVTSNYDGSVPGNNDFTRNARLTGWLAAAGGAQNPAGDPRYAAGAGVALASSSFLKGESTTTPSYIYPAIPSLPSDVFLRAGDSDGVSSLRGAASKEEGISIVSGRLLIPNSYGSALLPLTIRLRAQFWTSQGAWLSNSADSSSVVKPATVNLSNCLKNLRDPGGACKAALQVLGGADVVFDAGLSKFQLRGPGAGNNGSVDLQFQAPSNPSSLYLPSAKGRATFGIYKAGPVIYLRELY